MAIRLPLRVAAQFDNSTETGAGSVAGGVPLLVTLPQDTDNVVVKLSASVAGAGVSAVLQTTDDGGTTWWDVGRTSIVSNATPTVTAEWLSIPVISPGIGRAILQTTSSVYQGSIGRAGASTLGVQAMSGLPILSQQARVFLRITGDVTVAASNSIITTVMTNSQSATA